MAAAMTTRPHLLPRLLPIWGVTLLLELAIWWFLGRTSYYRELYLPLALAVVIGGLAQSFRVVRGWRGERRGEERRRGERRG